MSRATEGGPAATRLTTRGDISKVSNFRLSKQLPYEAAMTEVLARLATLTA